MPTYNPQISISAAPGITQYLRLALYEATAPNTEVAATAHLAPPHNSSRQLQFTGLRPVIHLAKLFITDGANPIGTIIANFSLDPRYPGVRLKSPLWLVADETPGLDSGTHRFTDPDGELEGWSYWVEIRGFGPLKNITDDDPGAELDTTAPGYSIEIPDYEIQPGEIHIVHFEPQIVTYTNTDDGIANLFSEVVLLTDDTALTSTDYGKLFLLQGSGATLRITLPEIDGVIAGKPFLFASEGGSHKNVVLEVEGSDSEKIDYLHDELTELILGQSEELWLFKWVNPDDSNDRRWKVLKCSEGPQRVGEIVATYNKTDLKNCVFADGTLLDRDVYPRLWAYVQSLDASILISDATWSSSTDNQAKFSTGDGSTTFRLPKLYNHGFLRGVDGSTRKAGSYENESVPDHHHLTGEFVAATNDDWKAITKNETDGVSHNFRTVTGEGNLATGSGTITASRATGTSKNIADGTGANMVKNTAAYLLIRI